VQFYEHVIVLYPIDKILIYVVSILSLIILVPLFHKYVTSRQPRSRGRKVLYHVLYLVVMIAALIFIPNAIQSEIFSPGGVLVVGTLVPIYFSVIACCSIGEEDDTTWLQYWITSSIVSFSTEFMDTIIQHLPAAGEHWYEFEFFFYLWLFLPYTDGAALIYDVVTQPYAHRLLSASK
jgi:TB2/DP1, HVA22 family